MNVTLDKIKKSAQFNWKMGFALTAYFMLLALVNVVFTSDIPFIILAWPNYLFAKHAGLAALLEMIFAYVVATFLVFLFNEWMQDTKKDLSDDKLLGKNKTQ